MNSSITDEKLKICKLLCGKQQVDKTVLRQTKFDLQHQVKKHSD